MHRTAHLTAAAVTGLMLVILMVMGVSRALFTNPTSNDANVWRSGNVVLVNEGALVDGGSPTFDETGMAVFAVTDMVPGDTETVCFEVIYEGSVDADILLDSVTIAGVNENSMGAELNMTIDRHTSATCVDGSPAAVASGTLSAPVITETAWQPAVPGVDESRYYKISVGFDVAASNTVQGSTVDDVEFEWLATNN